MNYGVYLKCKLANGEEFNIGGIWNCNIYSSRCVSDFVYDFGSQLFDILPYERKEDGKINFIYENFNKEQVISFFEENLSNVSEDIETVSDLVDEGALQFFAEKNEMKSEISFMIDSEETDKDSDLQTIDSKFTDLFDPESGILGPVSYTDLTEFTDDYIDSDDDTFLWQSEDCAFLITFIK